MSAERNISPQEYELLSAYIDGELTVDEQQMVEQRLLSDVLLKQELEALQSTVNLIHQLPEMMAPRNFTLTPEMVSTSKIIPLRTQRKPYNAYLSLVASITLMVFGAIFLLSEVNQPSLNRAAISSNEQSFEAVAILPTSTVNPTIETDAVEGDAVMQAVEEAEVPADEEGTSTTMALRSVESDVQDGFVGDASLTDSDVMFEADDAESEEMTDSGMGAMAGSSMLAPEPTLLPITSESVAEDLVSAPEELTIESSVSELDKAVDEPMELPSAPPIVNSERSVGGVEIGIGLFVCGLLFLVVAFGLFRRNRR